MTINEKLLDTGSTACFGLAACYLAASLCAVAMPPELQGRPDISPHEFWMILSSHPWTHLTFHWIWVLGGFFGIAAVPIATAALGQRESGWAMWSGLAAWLGFAVQTRSHLMEVAFDRRIIRVYADASPAFQEAVHVVAGLALDIPDGVLTYGATGTWIATISWVARRSGLLSTSHSRIGYAAAATSWAGMLGYMLQIRPLLVISFSLGCAVLIPAWYVGLAMSLRRRSTGYEATTPSSIDRAAPVT